MTDSNNSDDIQKELVPKVLPKEDFETRVGRWQSADSLRNHFQTSSSSIYYFEKNNTKIRDFSLERREHKNDEGEKITQFRAIKED